MLYAIPSCNCNDRGWETDLDLESLAICSRIQRNGCAVLLSDALDSSVDPGLARLLVDEIVVGLPYSDPWVLWSEDLQEWALGKGARLPS